MRAQVIAALVLGLATAASARQAPRPAVPQLTPAQIEAQRKEADAARGDEQVRGYINLFEQEIEMADGAYTDGDADRGLSLVNDAVADAERARDSAVKGHKLLKKLEMHVRKSARRLDDIRRSLALDDRPPVGKAVDRLNGISRDLLSKMFSGKDRP